MSSMACSYFRLQPGVQFEENASPKRQRFLTTDTMADVNINTPAGQAPVMAPPVRTDDQIFPRIRWVPIGKSNCYLDKSQSNPIYKIAWFELTKDTLRDALQITPVNHNQTFTSPPSTDALINLINELGYPKFKRPRAPILQILWGVVTRAHIDYAERIWEEFTQSIHTFIDDKRILTQHTSGNKKATLIVILSIRFTKLIIHHLQRKHKFHPRPDSQLHLPNEEPVLGYLKFGAKGTKREVFGMPIPGSLITADIQKASYYQEYLANVAKHRRYLAGKTGSDQDSPAPKPTKPIRKPKSMAPKAPPRPSFLTPVTSAQPAPTSAPAKPQEKKRKLTTETSGKPSKAKKSKYGFVGKKRTLKSVAESVSEEHLLRNHMLLLKMLICKREPESRKYQPLLEVTGKGKERHTSTPTGSSGHNESLYAELGKLDSEEESEKVVTGADEEGQGEGQSGPDSDAQLKARRDQTLVQENLKLTVKEHVLLEEPASSSGTLSSLQHLSKDISFGDLFFSDKPSNVDNDKTNAETEVESMVSVTIQQDMSLIPPMTSPIIDLTSRPESSKRISELEHIMANLIQENKELEERLDSNGARLYTLEQLDILHQLYEALEKSMNRDHSEEIAKDLAEARKKKKKSRESPKTPPGSPPHQPPPPPLPTGPFRASGALGASGPSQVSPPPPPSFTNQENLEIDEDMALDEQTQSLDDEDIRKATWSISSSDVPVPTNNWASALASNYSPPPEDSLLTQTGDIATFMDWFRKRRGITELKPQDLEGPAFEIVKVFHPDVIHLQYQMEECHKLLTDSVDDPIIRHNVSKPLPLGGPPGQVTIQSDFFFNKDLEYLRYDSKGSRPALSISKIKAAYYLDAGLEQMVPDQFWIEEECKYNIAAMYGISYSWFQRQRFYIDRHTSEGGVPTEGEQKLTINLKLNPRKCSFRVEEGIYFGHLVTKQGIRADPSKVKAISALTPKTVSEIQNFSRKLAALNRFLSKSKEKGLPFMKTLKSCTSGKMVQWTTEANEAFRRMKECLESLPTMVIPTKGEHEIEFKGKNSIKGQILADFLAETSSTKIEEEKDGRAKRKEPEPENTWKLFTDGASSSNGSGAGLMLVNLEGKEYTYALRFEFKTTNNEGAEQEADALSKLASMTFSKLAKEVLVEVIRPRRNPTKRSAKGKETAHQSSAIQDIQREAISKVIHVTMVEANGQVEVTNREIVKGMEQRLGMAHQAWVDELPQVLWAHRTTHKSSNRETPFSLVYGSEVVIAIEISVERKQVQDFDSKENEKIH
nr:hypothetical protein [Tanacetum cinerariifolium]